MWGDDRGLDKCSNGGVKKKRETAPLCRFCFYCARSLGNTVYPGFNGSVASLRARRGHTGSAGACTKPKVKGCSRGRPPGGRRKARRGAPGPGRIPARSPGTGQGVLSGGAELLRPTGGWNFPPDGCYSCMFRLAV